MEHVFQKVSTSSHCLPLKSLLDTERSLIAGTGQRGVQIKGESSHQSGRRNPGDRLHGQADGLGNAALGGKGQGLCRTLITKLTEKNFSWILEDFFSIMITLQSSIL